MAREIERLSALGVKRQKTPGYYPDGAGLYLQVSPSGSKSWIFRFKIKGRPREMGLGSAGTFELAEARARAGAARKLLADGIDPIAHRDALQNALQAAAARQVTFETAAADFIAAKASGWRNAKHAQQWETTLKTHAFPKIGRMFVGDIQMSHVLSVLKPIWNVKTETASRVRSRIEAVISSGDKVAGIERLNPARWKGNLDTQLAKPSSVAKVVHHKALAIDEMGAFMAALRAQAGIAAKALDFAILTAARSGEVRGARWSEIDFDSKTWIVPASRMKAGREHRAALSPAAIQLLEAMQDGASELIFPAPRGGELSDMTLSAVMRRMKVDAVPHGFRSTFRDWAAERTHYPHEVAEMALAHGVGDKTEAAYRRGDLLQKRFAIMADWASFLSKPAAQQGKVVPIKAA